MDFALSYAPDLLGARFHHSLFGGNGEDVGFLPDDLADGRASTVRQQHQRIARHALAKVRELGAFVGALLQGPVELRERQDGDVQLLGERLEAAGDLADLLLARVDALVAFHELQVVDDDQPERSFAVGEFSDEAACLRSQLQRGE